MVKPFVVALVLATLAASTLAQEMEEETFPIAPGKVQRVVIVNQPRTYTVQGLSLIHI